MESAVTPPTHCSERDTGLRNFSYAIRYAPEAPVDGISSPSSDCWTMNRFKALLRLTDSLQPCPSNAREAVQINLGAWPRDQLHTLASHPA